MLADPGFMEADAIEVLHQLEVAMDRQRGILVDWMEGSEEDACAQRCSYCIRLTRRLRFDHRPLPRLRRTELLSGSRRMPRDHDTPLEPNSRRSEPLARLRIL